MPPLALFNGADILGILPSRYVSLLDDDSAADTMPEKGIDYQRRAA